MPRGLSTHVSTGGAHAPYTAPRRGAGGGEGRRKSCRTLRHAASRHLEEPCRMVEGSSSVPVGMGMIAPAALPDGPCLLDERRACVQARFDDIRTSAIRRRSTPA